MNELEIRKMIVIFMKEMKKLADITWIEQPLQQANESYGYCLVQKKGDTRDSVDQHGDWCRSKLSINKKSN